VGDNLVPNSKDILFPIANINGAIAFAKHFPVTANKHGISGPQYLKTIGKTVVILKK
jgi:hypothetical protein